MAKYRKKTLTEFVPYEKGMEDGIQDFYEDGGYALALNAPYIKTLEGKMIISPGDYIGTGPKGERYPIKPDILAATYEKVEE